MRAFREKGRPMKRLALLLVCAAACKSSPEAKRTEPDKKAAYKAVVDAPDRSEADRKLDPGRHPVEMLEFLELKPGMKVLDLGAGGGYTSELMARAVAPGGVVYMQNDPSWLPFLKDALEERSTHPAMKDVVRVDLPFQEPVPADAKNLDLAVMNVIYHDVANMPGVDRLQMNKQVFDALRPGGVYILIDSSAKGGSGLSDTKTLHRIDESVVKDEVQNAGFRLDGQGSFLRNPSDQRDWNSSPGAAAKEGRRGTSDRFALRFVKPEGSR
jgi:predicted methyltransferase